MPNTWGLNRLVDIGGRFLVLMTAPGDIPYDVTFLRSAPVRITYSSADPFSDSVATLTFQQVTAYDDPFVPSSALKAVLADDAAVDIWWVPAQTIPAAWPSWFVNSNPDTSTWQNDLTGQADLVAPTWTYTAPFGAQGAPIYTHTPTRRGTKVWEGFVTSQQVNTSDQGDTLELQCQGALYQLDAYLAKPFYPPRPQPLEQLIGQCFDRRVRPHLRTGKYGVLWPNDWILVAPKYDRSLDNAYWPDISPGAKWTGYVTRQTGSWDHMLTSYIQQMLAVMIVKSGASSGTGVGTGNIPGNQWTLRMAHEGDTTSAPYSLGLTRTPYLTIRDRFRTPDFYVWSGMPGVQVNLTRDATQRADAIYGSGTDLGGTAWDNQIISHEANRTDYQPLATSSTVYPVINNKRLVRSRIAREQYVQYGSGFSEVDGINTAQATLPRELDAGWSGSVLLSTDVRDGSGNTIPRWTIQAGWTLRLNGWRGRGSNGLQLHIAQVDVDVEAGTVNLTVDTRYRDLLTLTEALDRTRDALTPARLLQLNKNSVAIEDIQARWNYAKGAGCCPQAAHLSYKHMPTSEQFPYKNWVKANPPKAKQQWYVQVNANDTKIAGHRGRWSGPHRVRMSAKGTIRRTEFAVYDLHGNLLPIPFSICLLYSGGTCNNTSNDMPHQQQGTGKNIWVNYDPLAITGAFEQIDPTTGGPWADAGHFGGLSQTLCMAWGNKEQPAGYSPGLKTQGARPTGMFVDESPWTYDCSQNNQNYQPKAKAGTEKVGVISVCAWLYANYDEPVYFMGRMFYQAPGTASG